MSYYVPSTAAAPSRRQAARRTRFIGCLGEINYAAICYVMLHYHIVIVHYII